MGRDHNLERVVAARLSIKACSEMTEVSMQFKV
jgi:hypothetical protein